MHLVTVLSQRVMRRSAETVEVYLKFKVNSSDSLKRLNKTLSSVPVARQLQSEKPVLYSPKHIMITKLQQNKNTLDSGMLFFNI